MAAAIIAPFMGEVAVAAGEALVELGVPQKLSQIAVGFVAGAVTQKIAEPIDEAVYNKIGEENIEKAKSYANEAFTLGKVYYGFTNEQTFQAEMTKLREEQLKKSMPTKRNQFETHCQPVVPVDNTVDEEEEKQLTNEQKEALGSLINSLNTKKMTVTPKNIANYIVKYSSILSLMPEPDYLEAEKMLIEQSPELKETQETLNGFFKGFIPNTDEYKQIASVYNGKNLTIKNNYYSRINKVNGLYESILIDEIRNRFMLTQNVGKILPSLYGIYCGPLSINNAPPISLLDLFCCFHDYDYHESEENPQGGWFNKIGDMKLVSRISQNFERFTDEEKKYAKITLLYFTTVGSMMSSLFGKSDANVEIHEEQPIMGENDIYTAVNGIENLEPEELSIDRKKFYDDLFSEYKKSHITESSVSGGSTNPYVIRQRFENIMIQLL